MPRQGASLRAFGPLDGVPRALRIRASTARKGSRLSKRKRFRMSIKQKGVDPLRYLHPVASTAFRKLTVALEDAWKNEQTPTYFRPYCGYRSPIEQEKLLKVEPRVTLAGPFQSAHQYGLALDFVAWEREAWSWADNHDWAFLLRMADEFGLSIPISWDKGHVEHPAWRDLAKTLKRFSPHFTA